MLDYLRSNPDFFQRHATAIAELSLSHESGKAVSLIEHQVAILRERNMTMRRRMNELLHAARSNDEIFAKTRSLNLALLEVNSWHELNEVLATPRFSRFRSGLRMRTFSSGQSCACS